MSSHTEKPQNLIKDIDDLITKEEMNLVEYPIGLIAERATKVVKTPEGIKKREEIKTIEYEDWIAVNGEKRKLKWTVTSTDKFGLPTGQDQDFFIAIMEVWREHQYKDRTIPIGSVYHMLKKMNLDTTGQNYRRFVLALRRYKGVNIYTEYALWDKTNQSYLKEQAFSIIDDYYLCERFKKSNTSIPLPFGWIKMNDFIHTSILNGNIKNLNLTLYLALPNPLSRRLYRYLDKKRYYGRTFTMNVKKLACKLGFFPDAVEKYRPAKLRSLLKVPLESLIEKGFLERYSFEPGKEGEKLKVFFSRSGEGREQTQAGAAKPADGEADYIVSEVLEFTGDEHSKGYYHKLVREMGAQRVFAILSETKQADREGNIKTTRAKYFTDLAQRYRGVKPLG